MNYIFNQDVLAGLECSRNNFWSLLRNPVYCGKITVQKFRTEKKYTVSGIDERLISTLLFDQAQEFLNRTKKVFMKSTATEQLILRGFLFCPNCSKVVTGSACIKGRSERYYCSLRAVSFREVISLISIFMFVIFL